MQFLIKSAFTGAVATVALIPVFLKIFRELRSVHQTLSPEGGVYSQEISTILLAGELAFTILPIASTIGAIGVAYVNLGASGVVLYLLISSAAAGMLAGSTAAVMTFMLGAVAMVIVRAFKSRSRHQRRPPIRPR
ncbi:hypothetical protein EFA46_009050 [Halarchaeum sp. CBA1220]|uniref:hypothetical protein n=1 Tax=Halarchaeum sp. CBA1220 TaxID=1853682 RepID=UPI0011CD5D9C|nr:hypothetical protein [Halarchaeum sp. CBA1220]QLC34347.1 hypothetical protein EFA46_009050 [Halarchaeum sp. CBA1220]